MVIEAPLMIAIAGFGRREWLAQKAFRILFLEESERISLRGHLADKVYDGGSGTIR